MLAAADRIDRLEVGTRPELSGVPYVAKDIIDTAGVRTTGGTSALRNHIPISDAPVIEALNAGGAIMAGKANLHELSFGITSNNGVFGPVRNPHDQSKIAGGSSGGSAAAVAAGLVPCALAADTGGSSRLPAALCGVVGYRPTLGRYSAAGLVPISWTRDTVGVIAQTVNDVRAVDSVLAHRPIAHDSNPAGDLRDVRIGRPAHICIQDLDPDVFRTYTATLDALSAAGATVVELDLAAEFETANRIGLPIALYEFPIAVARYLADSGNPIDMESLGAGIGSPDVRAVWSAVWDNPVDRTDYDAVLDELKQIKLSYAAKLTDADVTALCFPTSPVVAQPIGHDNTVELNGEYVAPFPLYTTYANLAGVLGTPGISLPAGMSEAGLPIGIEFDGLAGDDARLLSLTDRFAQVLE